ncbi:unnamed protein product [Blepharisma stoltei]|uniref:Maturase K n=1 Tax=Blepharisma stoltei TaxID=1481888 RepID=A0AAU9JCX7_9CILI|nr:unnamed protein product [Blepharisma stoltei]
MLFIEIIFIEWPYPIWQLFISICERCFGFFSIKKILHNCYVNKSLLNRCIYLIVQDSSYLQNLFSTLAGSSNLNDSCFSTEDADSHWYFTIKAYFIYNPLINYIIK